MLLSGATFSVSNFLLNGSMNKTVNLSGELKSPPDSLYQWRIAEEPPFRYRVLHRIIVSTTYHLFRGQEDNNSIFFLIYKMEAFLFHTLAILLFYFFLIQINLSEYAFIGAVLFTLLPPLSLAYNVPVHTREDALAYCILILGLLSIIKNKAFQILLFAIAGVLCRETLLLIPFVNLFFNKSQYIYTRLAIAAVTFAVFVGLRLYYGIEKYNYWEGFDWNTNNLEQVIGFAYLTFGFLWFPFFISFIEKKEDGILPRQLIYRSSLSVFLLVVFTTFLGGIFNEIRILYLLAPWVISIGLFYLNEHKVEVTSKLKSRNFQLYASLLLMAIIAITIYGLAIVNKYFTSNYDIPYSTWIITLSIQSYLGLLCLPYFYNAIYQKFKSMN